MRNLFLLLFVIVFLPDTYSQNADLIGMKGEGNMDKISLLFDVNTWADSLDGFFIKRRVFDQNNQVTNWKKLNNQIIIPGNSLEKNLNNVTNNGALVKRLFKLREQYFSNTGKLETKLSKISSEDLKKNFSNEDFNQIIKLLFAFDYHIALMYGLGYVDYRVPNRAGRLEYGLFPVYNGIEDINPITTYSWSVGDRSNLNVVIEDQKIKRRRNKVSLAWSLNKDSIDNNYDIVGFNIYRKTIQGEYTKLNHSAIWLNRATKNRTVYYEDSIPNREINYLYALVPVSLFNTEGDKYEMLLNTKIPDILPAPELKSDLPYGFDFIKEGVKFSWEYDSLYNNSISGFLVKRMDNVVDGFKVVSDTLKPDTRSFYDKNIPLTDEKKYYYILQVLQQNSFPIETKRLTYVYDPIIRFSELLEGTPEINDGNVFVNLSWSKDQENMDKINGFQLKLDFGADIMASINSMPLIHDYNYSYKIEGATGKKYRFTICAMDKKNRSLPYSDTISVTIPSLYLPNISFSEISSKENSIVLNWNYSEIVDLAGFRIFNHGKLVIDEKEITADKRSWAFSGLAPGKYDFSIQAVSKYGIKSEVSFYHKKTEIY